MFCAHIIDTLRKAKDNATLFYFCRHDTTDKDRPSHFLRTLVMQLVQTDSEYSSFIWDTYICNAEVPSNDVLAKLLPKLLSGTSSTRLILDGLDEYTAEEGSSILSMLYKLSKLSSSSPCSILISSRDEEMITRVLRNKPTISLMNQVEAVAKDMSIFVTARIDQAISDWGLQVSEITLKTGKEQLLQKSKGG